MKPEDNNIDEVLKRHLPSASQEEAEADCDHVLQHLRVRAQRRASSSPKRRLRWFTMAAAAAIILTVFISPMVFREAPAVLEVAARKVHFGEVVSSNVFGEVVVLADGSRVEMRTDSELVLERADDGVRVRLTKGGVIVNAAKQHSGHLYVQTKDVLVSVVGTVFLVNAEAEGSRVAVYEGEVRVLEAGKERKLRSGEQVATGSRMELLAMKEAIAWSRQAKVTAALLPEPAPVAQQAPPGVRFEEVSIRRTSGDVPPGVRGGNANVNIQGSGCSAGSAVEIDPARFALSGKNLLTITAMAYFGSPFQACLYAAPLGLLSGGDSWTRTDGFDIQAVIPAGAFTVRPTLRDPKLQKMLQTMLEERFKLVIQREMKEMPVYVMTWKDPAKMATAPDGVWLTTRKPDFLQEESRQGLVAQEGPAVYGANLTMTDLAQLLGRMMGRPVVDRTGFTRKFSFSLEYEFDSNPATRSPLSGARNPGEVKSLIAEFEKQAGIKFEPSKDNLEVLVIDHAEKPSEN